MKQSAARWTRKPHNLVVYFFFLRCVYRLVLARLTTTTSPAILRKCQEAGAHMGKYLCNFHSARMGVERWGWHLFLPRYLANNEPP